MSDEGVDKIISHIEEEAKKEISEILHKAQAEADKIRKAAQGKANLWDCGAEAWRQQDVCQMP